MNTITKAVYTKKIDDVNYSQLICTFGNGEEKIFHFCASNPVPKEYAIEGLTWDELRGIMLGMWRMAIGEYILLNDKGENNENIKCIK